MFPLMLAPASSPRRSSSTAMALQSCSSKNCSSATARSALPRIADASSTASPETAFAPSGRPCGIRAGSFRFHLSPHLVLVFDGVCFLFRCPPDSAGVVRVYSQFWNRCRYAARRGLVFGSAVGWAEFGAVGGDVARCSAPEAVAGEWRVGGHIASRSSPASGWQSGQRNGRPSSPSRMRVASSHFSHHVGLSARTDEPGGLARPGARDRSGRGSIPAPLPSGRGGDGVGAPSFDASRDGPVDASTLRLL